MTTKQSYMKEIREITKQIVDKYKPRKIVLFGSCAKGKMSRDSDIDMLIIKNTKESFWRRMYNFRKLIEPNQPFEALVLTEKELKERLRLGDFFIQDILNEGKVLYEA